MTMQQTLYTSDRFSCFSSAVPPKAQEHRARVGTGAFQAKRKAKTGVSRTLEK
jgi:hypothetical protein